MKKNMLLLFLCLLQRGQAQNFTGVWTGMLEHISCLSNRSGFGVKLTVKAQGNGLEGTILYYGQSAIMHDSTAYTTWAFRFRGKESKAMLIVNYEAADELYRRRYNAGYQIGGSYKVALVYSKNEATGIERLTGYYTSHLGARGKMYLQRAMDAAPVAPTTDSSGSILNRLRSRIAERKKPPPDTSLTALLPPTGTAMPDSSSFFAALPPAPTVDSALLLTLEKKNSRRLDTTTVLALDRASYVDIQIYDNAVEDGDTISILADSQLVVHRAQVGIKPIIVRLLRPENRSTTQVMMVAENMGTIPPNTAYLVFEADDKTRYTINLSSSFTQSGSIILKWK